MIRPEFNSVDAAVRPYRILPKKYEVLTSDEGTNHDYVENIKSLVKRGLKLGKNVTIETEVTFDQGYPHLISIGDNCGIGMGTRIHAHDDTPYKFTGGHARLGQVNILDNVLIGEGSCRNDSADGVQVGIQRGD